LDYNLFLEVDEMIRALVFDFDGLILETEGPIFLSWQALYASYGFPLPFEVWATTIGSAEAEFNPARELERLVRQALDWERIEPERQKNELALISRQPLLPGVEQVLQEARRMGLKLGLASSSSCKWVEGHLRERGLRSYFEVVRAADDVRLTGRMAMGVTLMRPAEGERVISCFPVADEGGDEEAAPAPEENGNG
jgi:beta-phosphoglucomutase-like phosphatase (HAD superfamily)